MTQDFIQRINIDEITELILDAKSQIVFSSASIHHEIAILLSEAARDGIDVTVIVDFTEGNIRNGFGEMQSIDLLEKRGVEVLELEGNLISFLIVDNIGLFLFQQSKIFIDKASGVNAVFMDEITRLKILSFYFPHKAKEIDLKNMELIEKIKENLNSVDEYSKSENNISLKKIEQEKKNRIRQNLKITPVVQPNLRRRISTYTAKVQFVELTFEKSNIQTKKVVIPPNALPFQDTELKDVLETKLNLFGDIGGNSDFKKLNKLKEKVDNLRVKPNLENEKGAYLFPIKSRKKSIIKVLQKHEFNNKLESIKKEIDDFKKGTLEGLNKEILKRKKAIRKELGDFLKVNPPKQYKGFKQENLFDAVDDLSNTIISKIKFPDLTKLISGLELKYNFYDLTIDDFRDDDLIAEFRKKKILKGEELDDIVSIKEAFEATR